MSGAMNVRQKYSKGRFVSLEPVDAVNDSASTPVDTPIIINVLANDTYNPGRTISVISGPSVGSIGAINQEAGTITYIPTSDPGSDSFVYQLDDASGTDTATVSITINF